MMFEQMKDRIRTLLTGELSIEDRLDKVEKRIEVLMNQRQQLITDQLIAHMDKHDV